MVRLSNKCLRPLCFFLLTSSYVHGVKYILLTQIAYFSVTISRSSEKSGIWFSFLSWASANFSLDQDPFSGYLYEVIPSCRVSTQVASPR